MQADSAESGGDEGKEAQRSAGRQRHRRQGARGRGVKEGRQDQGKTRQGSVTGCRRQGNTGRESKGGQGADGRVQGGKANKMTI